jgi:rubredoxin
MFRKNYTVKINLPGGIVAAGDLYAIVEAAGRAKVSDMQFGTRQQLFCKVADQYGAAFCRELETAGIFYETEKEQFPNIVSSYVTEDVFGKSQWVSEGLYKDVLDGFDFRPRLKINLVESGQSFIPFFSGNINFVSSGIGNYWYLYVRLPRATQVHRWNELVYFRDIPRISRVVEEGILGGSATEPGLLFARLREQSPFITQPVVTPLSLPIFNLPYYEGFNRYGDKTWLGIYRREELFPLSFLKDICIICLQTKVGQLYTTPWKSLIIKGIEDKDRHLWEYVLGKYRINVRHASNELNWQVEDFCPDGLRLKRYLVRQFDLEDVRTEGLCFAIKTKPFTGLSGSVIIRRREATRPGQGRLMDRYDILHTPDFNANSKEYILYREGLEKESLSVYLVSLCKDFYGQQTETALIPDAVIHPERTKEGSGRERQIVFQCRHCLTVYDEQYGDPDNGAPAGLPFGQTRPDYACPVCGGAKEGFGAIEKTLLVQA